MELGYFLLVKRISNTSMQVTTAEGLETLGNVFALLQVIIGLQSRYYRMFGTSPPPTPKQKNKIK